MSTQSRTHSNVNSTHDTRSHNSSVGESRPFADVLKTESFQEHLQSGAIARPGHTFSQVPVDAPAAAMIQTKLTVGEPNDLYEQEADRVAAQVMRMSDPVASEDDDDPVQARLASGAIAQPKIVQRKEETAAPIATSGLESQLNQTKGSGSSLPETFRNFIEPRMGFSFANVRVHTDSAAVQMNRDLNAQAFTHGSDIYFGDGKYNPGSDAGKELLAHELTHVVQQTGGIQRSPLSTPSAGTLIQRDPGGGGPTTTADPATEAPQETGQQSVVDLVTSECGGLSQDAIQQVENFLLSAHQEIDTWESWRNQEGWEDTTISSEIPPIDNLLYTFDTFHTTSLDCEGEGTINPEHTLVRQLITYGTEAVDGLNTGELNLVNEWMRYENDLQNPIQEYFCLNPESAVQHHYTLRVDLSSGKGEELLGVGAGLGGAVETPLFQVSLGCYVKAGVSGGWVEFAYHNDLGMTWQQSYLQVDGNVQGECSAQFSIGPAVNTSFGDDALCSGYAYPDPHETWYGPQDFTGATITHDFGVSGGVGLTGGVAAGHLWVEPANKTGVGFNTTGACLGLMLGGGAAASTRIGGVGGQWDMGEADLSNPSVTGIGADGSRTGYGLCEDNPVYNIEELLITRHFYFDTGDSDPQQGRHAIENNAATAEILRSLDEALSNGYVSRIVLDVDGHASPIWRGARSPAAADRENSELALQRAESTSLFVLEALDQFGGDLPPVSIVPSGECHADGPSSAVETGTESHGSNEGLTETSDRRNDYQRYRRATVRVKIERSLDPLMNSSSVMP
jgi:hypothetical protein